MILVVIEVITLFNILGKFIRKLTSWKHLRIKTTPDLHLTYSKYGGNQGSV